MGRYIQTGNSVKNKAAIICSEFDGEIITVEQAENLIGDPESVAIVCVVDNGPFEAAGYCYDRDEFNEFSSPGDYRTKTWIAIREVQKVREAAP
jgi:hypothetical protein